MVASQSFAGDFAGPSATIEAVSTENTTPLDYDYLTDDYGNHLTDDSGNRLTIEVTREESLRRQFERSLATVDRAVAEFQALESTRLHNVPPESVAAQVTDTLRDLVSVVGDLKDQVRHVNTDNAATKSLLVRLRNLAIGALAVFSPLGDASWEVMQGDYAGIQKVCHAVLSAADAGDSWLDEKLCGKE